MRVLLVALAALAVSGCSCNCNPPVATTDILADAGAPITVQLNGVTPPPSHPPAPPAEVTDFSPSGVPVEMLVPPRAVVATRKDSSGKPMVEISKGQVRIQLLAGDLSLDAWRKAYTTADWSVERSEDLKETWSIVLANGRQQYTYATFRSGVVCQAIGVEKLAVNQVEKLCSTVARPGSAVEQLP